MNEGISNDNMKYNYNYNPSNVRLSSSLIRQLEHLDYDDIKRISGNNDLLCKSLILNAYPSLNLKISGNVNIKELYEDLFSRYTVLFINEKQNVIMYHSITKNSLNILLAAYEGVIYPYINTIFLVIKYNNIAYKVDNIFDLYQVIDDLSVIRATLSLTDILRRIPQYCSEYSEIKKILLRNNVAIVIEDLRSSKILSLISEFYGSLDIIPVLLNTISSLLHDEIVISLYEKHSDVYSYRSYNVQNGHLNEGRILSLREDLSLIEDDHCEH